MNLRKTSLDFFPSLKDVIDIKVKESVSTC